MPYPEKMMPRPPNIILHSPLRDPAVLDVFVERCLADRVAWIAVVGDDAAIVEDLIDEIVVGEGTDPGRFILTTSHSTQSSEGLLDLISVLSQDGTAEVEQVRL